MSKKLNLRKGKPYPIPKRNVEIMLYPISELAAALGRTTQTVRKWEKNLVIPESVFRDSTGKRLYSEEQISLIVETADKEHIRQGESIENSNFTKIIFSRWKDVTKETIAKGTKIKNESAR